MITENTFAYLIRAGKTDNYKIGISSNTQSRLVNLQTAHYEKLSILTTSKFETRFIALEFEAELHNNYKGFNTIGEWFRFSNEQIIDIKKLFKSEVSEVILLRARICELEARISSSEEPILKEKSKGLNPKDVVLLLWANVKMGESEKLTPKTKVINKSSRHEVTQLSAIYKTLVEEKCIKLDGNQGYFALVDCTFALVAVGAKDDK